MDDKDLEIARLKGDLALSRQEADMWKTYYERIKALSDRQEALIVEYGTLLDRVNARS